MLRVDFIFLCWFLTRSEGLHDRVVLSDLVKFVNHIPKFVKGGDKGLHVRVVTVISFLYISWSYNHSKRCDGGPGCPVNQSHPGNFPMQYSCLRLEAIVRDRPGAHVHF